MEQVEPNGTSPRCDDVGRRVKHNHLKILGLFLVYLRCPPDSRQAIQEQILHQLTSHVDTDKELLFREIRKLGPQGLTLVRGAEVENEHVKSRILQLQQTEGDDDQARDEVFEDMMESVRVLFMTEERDLLPLVARS